MQFNDIFRSVRHLLNISETQVSGMLKKNGLELTADQISAYLMKETDDGFEPCPPGVLSVFLNALITERRGVKEGQAPVNTAMEVMDNNAVLKKLRIAFELKEEDLMSLMKSAGFAVSKGEVNALFRKEGHPNYRKCNDQFLRYFLKGLNLKVRGGTI